MEPEVYVRIDEDWEAGRMYTKLSTEEEYNDTQGSCVVIMKQREYRMIELATEMFNETQRYLNNIYEGVVKEEDDEDWVTVVQGKSGIALQHPHVVVHTSKLSDVDFRGIPVYEEDK